MSSSSSQSVTPKSYVAWYKEYLRLYKPVYKNPTPADRGRLVALNSKGKLNPSLFEPSRSIIASNYDLTPISDQINPVVATLDHFLHDLDVLVEVYDATSGVLLPEAAIKLLSSDSLEITLPIQSFSGAWPIRVVILASAVPIPAVIPSSSSSLSQVGTNSNSSKSTITSDSSLSSAAPAGSVSSSSSSPGGAPDISSQSSQSQSSYIAADSFRILIDTTKADRLLTRLSSQPLVQDTTACQNIDGAWLRCTALTNFPALTTSNVSSARNTWDGCSSLTAFPALDLSLCTDLFAAWRGCSGLTSFPATTRSSAGS